MRMSKGVKVMALVAILISAAIIGSVLNVMYSPEMKEDLLRPRGAPAFKEGGEIASRRASAPSTGEASVNVVEVDLERLDRMVVRTAFMVLESENPDAVAFKVRFEVESLGGYVESMRVSSREGRRYAEVTVRVPEEKFFDAMDKMRALGRVLEEQVRGEDVTERYVDLEARLRNLKAEEEWLLKAVERAKTVEELMMIERELWRIRGEIEKIEGQMRYLERRVEYSSISIVVKQPPTPPLPPQPPTPDFLRVFYGALAALYVVVSGLVYLVVAGSPIAAIAYASYTAYKRIRKPSPP